MDNQKRKVIIVYSPASGDIKTLAEKIGSKYTDARWAVEVKAAGEVTIPEINASDIIVLGADEAGESLRDGGYREIGRALTGVNLAGKVGALFSFSMKSALDGLKEMVKDTGLKLIGTDLLLVQNGKSLKENKIDKWINQTCTTKA